ncbi:hypothetical protein DFQ14_1194 [Halopolyspora algeriensis]|uniref:Uncharacterized protein n=1 Tax=Halopolyspora algeriensis TaxID=1500506 RepID=A0A368VIG8_9ACTN|nr:hypothetical protein DFQ14_1194 [Halopolyspora algeriensis]
MYHSDGDLAMRDGDRALTLHREIRQRDIIPGLFPPMVHDVPAWSGANAERCDPAHPRSG